MTKRSAATNMRAAFAQIPHRIATQTSHISPAIDPHRDAFTMDPTGDDVKATLSLIEEAGLQHPFGPLLASFVTDALTPSAAARYVKGKLLRREGLSLVENWSYIVNSSKCFLDAE